jgi:hypothetical protein
MTKEERRAERREGLRAALRKWRLLAVEEREMRVSVAAKIREACRLHGYVAGTPNEEGMCDRLEVSFDTWWIVKKVPCSGLVAVKIIEGSRNPYRSPAAPQDEELANQLLELVANYERLANRAATAKEEAGSDLRVLVGALEPINIAYELLVQGEEET